jgi:hypothetical protein
VVVEVVPVAAVSVCVGAVVVVVVSVFAGRGVGFDRAGEELDEPVGGDDGWGTTVVVATAAPGAGLPLEVARVLVTGVEGVVPEDAPDDAGFVGMVVFATVAVVIVEALVSSETGAPVSVVPALLVVTVELVASVAALDDDSVLLHAANSMATANGISVFRMNYLRHFAQHNACRVR